MRWERPGRGSPESRDRQCGYHCQALRGEGQGALKECIGPRTKAARTYVVAVQWQNEFWLDLFSSGFKDEDVSVFFVNETWDPGKRSGEISSRASGPRKQEAKEAER